MVLSLRMQSLAKNPQIQRNSFHQMAAKMIGQKGVTNTAKKEMQKAGVYYGGKKLSKGKFEKNIRQFSQHLEEKGGKETRFAKQIRQSLRSKKGLVRGGVAEKEFHRDLKRQYKEATPQSGFDNLELGEKRKYLHKFLEKGLKGLTREDRKVLGEEGINTLKERGERIKAINQSRLQREREAEDKQGKSEDEVGVPKEKAVSSGTSRVEEEKSSSGQKPSVGAAPVPLAGGTLLGVGMANQIEGRVERIMNANLNSPEIGAKESQIEASSAENSSVRQDSTEEESYQNVLDKLVKKETTSGRKPDNAEDYPNYKSSAANKDESKNKAVDPYGGDEPDNDVDIP